MAESKITENQISQELSFIKRYINRMKTPSYKEYKNLLKTTTRQLSFLGAIGFGIKFVHMIINKVLIGA